MKRALKIRRTIAIVIVAALFGAILLLHPDLQQPIAPPGPSPASGDAAKVLDELKVNGRAPQTGYTRTQFGDGWARVSGCDTRNIILNRDLKNAVVDNECKVISGTLQDPYTGKTIEFMRGADTSDDVQIDHVVALSDAWQKGAQQLSYEQRVQFANDPLELLAVDGQANQQKSAGDAATWLPLNKAFRCQYVARQIAVKKKYTLWVTQAEKDAILRVLAACPGQALPV
jgi:hypothetical protein